MQRHISDVDHRKSNQASSAHAANGTCFDSSPTAYLLRVQGMVGQILQYGRVVRPVLGVNIAPPQALRQMGLQGVLVLEVPDGSPAAKAGLVS